MAGSEPMAALTVFTTVRRSATTTDCGSPSGVSTLILGTRSPWVNPTIPRWEVSMGDGALVWLKKQVRSRGRPRRRGPSPVGSELTVRGPGAVGRAHVGE